MSAKTNVPRCWFWLTCAAGLVACGGNDGGGSDLSDGGSVAACDDDNPCRSGVCLDQTCVQCTSDDATECLDTTPVCVIAAGGSVTVSQSTISRNRAGGISVTGVGALYDITNTFIFRNGDTSLSGFGGAELAVVGAPLRFEFNTVVDNRAVAGIAAGVLCTFQSIDLPNNLIARNTPLQTAADGCTFTSSVIQDDVTGLNFQSSEVDPLSYKLNSPSTAIDQSTKSSDVAIDFDGEPRPSEGRDVGADEFTPDSLSRIDCANETRYIAGSHHAQAVDPPRARRAFFRVPVFGVRVRDPRGGAGAPQSGHRDPERGRLGLSRQHVGRADRL